MYRYPCCIAYRDIPACRTAVPFTKLYHVPCTVSHVSILRGATHASRRRRQVPAAPITSAPSVTAIESPNTTKWCASGSARSRSETSRVQRATFVDKTKPSSIPAADSGVRAPLTIRVRAHSLPYSTACHVPCGPYRTVPRSPQHPCRERRRPSGPPQACAAGREQSSCRPWQPQSSAPSDPWARFSNKTHDLDIAISEVLCGICLIGQIQPRKQVSYCRFCRLYGSHRATSHTIQIIQIIQARDLTGPYALKKCASASGNR